MENKIAQLIELAQKLPEKHLEDAIKYIKEKIEEDAEEKPIPPCPHCGSMARRNGSKDGRRRYKCNDCCKSFGGRTNTTINHSHCGEAVWKQVIRDTLEGVSMDKSAKALMLSHSTVFRMRHKLLMALETEEAHRPTVLEKVCELDDTYVLESLKGKKIPEDYGRKARKHGAVAQKRGISNEYVCISTGVERDGMAYCHTVTRATPSKEDIAAVFDGHIGESVLVLCDGETSYSALKGDSCDVINVTDENKGGFLNINTVNGLHSFIKGRYNHYRGVATKYLNRYNILFAKMYRSGDDLADSIYNMIRSNDIHRFHSVNDVTSLGLLDI